MMKKILVVDDEAGLTRMIKANLERTGRFSVRAENDPTVAIAAARAFDPDLIFLDVMMPGMDGDELAARMKEDPHLAAIPVVFMTARVGSVEIRRLRELGAIGVLAKPFDPMRLAVQVRELWNTG